MSFSFGKRFCMLGSVESREPARVHFQKKNSRNESWAVAMLMNQLRNLYNCKFWQCSQQRFSSFNKVFFGFNIGIKGLSSFENVKHLYFDSLGFLEPKKKFHNYALDPFLYEKSPYRGCKIIESAKVWNDCVYVVPRKLKHDSFEKFVIFRLNRSKRYVSNPYAAL